MSCNVCTYFWQTFNTIYPLLSPFRKLLEKRIEKFTESTSQQLLISNPESESYVKDELRKLNDKWQSFKDQVKQKRKSLNQANEFFEVVEKVKKNSWTIHQIF